MGCRLLAVMVSTAIGCGRVGFAPSGGLPGDDDDSPGLDGGDDPDDGSSTACAGPLSNTFDMSPTGFTPAAANGSTSVQDGELVLDLNGQWPGFAGIRTDVMSLAGRSIAAEIPQVASGSNAATLLRFTQDSDDREIYIAHNGVGGLVLETYDPGSSTYETHGGASYSAIAHRWWRLTFAGTTVIAEASPDGAVWTELERLSGFVSSTTGRFAVEAEQENFGAAGTARVSEVRDCP